MKKLAVICLAAIMLTTAACGNKETPEQTTQPAQDAFADTTAAITVPTEETQPETTTEVETTEAETAEETTAEPQLPTETEDIVELFNETANKIKTNASSVTKNFEKRNVNKDRLVVPAGLQSTADSMISSFMKDDTDPIVYTGKDAIKENFIVPGQSYVSKLDPSYVKEATCTDKGDTYEIYLKLKSQTSPTAGSGIGAVCDVIEANEVADKAPFVEKFTTEYYNCEITATVDKETGKITHIVYSTPLTLNITVNMFGKHDLVIGFTFVKDYDIKY